jgi:hypothetical protein
MKWLKRFVVALVGLTFTGLIKRFFNNNAVLIFDKQELLEETVEQSMDLRGTPTHACICGSVVWNIKAVFDNYEIATYFLDMECAECGSLATAPTPLDREGLEN